MSGFLLKKYKDWSQDISALANPILLLLVSFLVLGNTQIFYHLLLLLLINEFICSVTKMVYHRRRPNSQTYKNLVEKIDAGSFPSIHSSRITLTYLTFFYHTNEIAIKITVIVVIILVMTSRIILKKHYLTDVVGGFIIGFLIWYFGMR